MPHVAFNTIMWHITRSCLCEYCVNTHSIENVIKFCTFHGKTPHSIGKIAWFYSNMLAGILLMPDGYHPIKILDRKPFYECNHHTNKKADKFQLCTRLYG